jgi:hypothetical protein
MINPSRVEAIQNTIILRNKKEKQYFIGKINFLRRFILIFAEIVKLITSMLRKYSEIKWTLEARKSFETIK